MALVVIPLSRVSPMIAGRFGVRVVGATGLSLMATGFTILSTLDAGSDYWQFLAGLLPFGAGMALAGAPATTAIVASLPREPSRASRRPSTTCPASSAGRSASPSSAACSTAATARDRATHARRFRLRSQRRRPRSLAAAEPVGAQLGAPGRVRRPHARARSSTASARRCCERRRRARCSGRSSSPCAHPAGPSRGPTRAWRHPRSSSGPDGVDSGRHPSPASRAERPRRRPQQHAERTAGTWLSACTSHQARSPPRRTTT